MKNLTFTNYLTWGFDSGQRLRSSATDNFFVQYGSITRPHSTFRNECIITAKLIYEQSKLINKPIALLYSGGLDSEVMLSAFITAKVPFEIYHLCCSRGGLTHETYYVDKFCKKYNLEYKKIDIDFLKFIETEAIDLSLEVKSNNIRLASSLYLMKILGDKYYTIIGNGEPLLTKNYTETNSDNFKPDEFIFIEPEIMFTWYNYPHLHNLDAVPGFFQFTPEQMLSYFTDPMIELINDGYWKEPNNRLIKYYLYKNAFHEFNFEKRIKFNGYEIYENRCLELNIFLENTLENIGISFNQYRSAAGWTIPDIIKNLYGDKVESKYYY